MSAISALLMSLQLQQGQPIDAAAIRAALLNTAIPCTAEETDEPECCLQGKINLPEAMNLLFGQVAVATGEKAVMVSAEPILNPANHVPVTTAASNTSVPPRLDTQPSPKSRIITPHTSQGIPPASLAPSAASVPPAPSASTSSAGSTVTPSTAHSGHVYALGTLGYDFGDETRRDSFKQRMAPVEIAGTIVRPDPYDAHQMVEHLDRNSDESRSLIWLLSLDQNTIYALEPKGPFAADIYEMFLLMLSGQLQSETSTEFVERISVPARRTHRTVELFSGEIVPVVTVHNVRGMYGWRVNALVDAALAAVLDEQSVEEAELRQALTAFLNRVYHDLQNVGQMSRDRALNFATTNIFQAASTFAAAIADGCQLDAIDVEKSPFCRINSDCWDIKLKFFDPENNHRADKIFRFTIDVADLVPVTLGEVKSWSVLDK